LSYPFKPELTVLKFDDVIDAIRQRMRDLPDDRTGKNIRYTMERIGMSGFSVFFMQFPSFLAHQKTMQESFGNSNANTFFGIGEDIPSDNHIRTMLNPTPPSHLFPLFGQIFGWLSDHNRLTHLRTIGGQLLIALDGTQYHSSKSIHCEQCSTKTHKDGSVSYSHTVITPVVVSPGVPSVLPLEPEFITPQDGHKKQDCETAAAKRWILQYGGRYAGKNVTILGDDLYSRTPLCKTILSEGFNFLLVCKPTSHKTLYEWVEEMDSLGKVSHLEVKRRRGKKVEIDHYRWVNQVPLTDEEDALQVNWCEIITTDPAGKTIYRNDFVTNHEISHESIVELIEAGRTRWKVENENNNTLKTKGYHLTHNFGHGKKHLSSLLLTMNLLAFLVHTLLEQMDSRYQLIRAKLPTRKKFFRDIAALTTYLLFRSFDTLLDFMLDRLENGPRPPPAYHDSS